jgi:hypothetical protein
MNITTILAVYASILATFSTILTFLKFRKEGELITFSVTFGSFTHDLRKKGTECLLITIQNKGKKIVTITGCSLFNLNNEKISLTNYINNLPKDITPNKSFIVAIDTRRISENKPKKIEFYTASGKIYKIRKYKLKKSVSNLINTS